MISQIYKTVKKLSFSLRIFVKNENIPMLRYLQSENWVSHNLPLQNNFVYSMACEKLSVEFFFVCFCNEDFKNSVLVFQNCCKEVQ